MKQTRLENICMDILAHWHGKRRIDEEKAYIFCEGILDQMDSQKKETAQEYQELTRKLHDMWHCKDFEKLSAEETFLCGGLWGGMKILEQSARRQDQQQTTRK